MMPAVSDQGVSFSAAQQPVAIDYPAPDGPRSG